ncbi:hypothetical protein [Streptomyces sp. 3N207]|uniref:hypothetical protein n=1 Tax=Streptomyces sp. 3N207 TaxID=3457417 RepID=UPI003FD2B0B8
MCTTGAPCALSRSGRWPCSHVGGAECESVSVRWFGEFEFWFALIKVAAITAFLAVGCWLLASRHPVRGQAGGPQLITDHGGMLPHGFVAALWSYRAWFSPTRRSRWSASRQARRSPPRTVVPKAINSVSWRSVVFYVGSVLLLVLLLPWSATARLPAARRGADGLRRGHRHVDGGVPAADRNRAVGRLIRRTAPGDGAGSSSLTGRQT